ncbi:MAG: arsenic transporter [Clostridia bacterium]|nr:arsenic transporter [Clostridia bacterium]
MTTIQIVLLLLFGVTYVLMMALSRARPYVALSAAVVFVLLGVIPGTGFDYGLLSAVSQIDWNVLLMIAGTMGLVALFIDSEMPKRMSDLLMSKMPNVRWMIVILSLFAGLVSAFVDNVATVLMIAPVALAVCRKLDVNPVAPLICIAVSSNLQGAATLVGDTTSILLGRAAHLDFMDFFWDQGRPGMFFVVEAGALASAFLIVWMFRREKQPLEHGPITEVEDRVPTVLLFGAIATLIAVSFIPYKDMADGGIYKPDITNGLICMTFFVIGLIRDVIRRRDKTRLKAMVAEIDYRTLLLLASLFVVIGGITRAGIIDKIGAAISTLGGSGSRANIFLIYTVIVFVSVGFSAFIDNIPYTATMLPVVASIAAALSGSGGLAVDPKLFYYGLLCGATLGGNLTPIGASANITAIGLLQKNGYDVRSRDFLRIGVPFTLTAVLVGYALIWLFWHP